MPCRSNSATADGSNIVQGARSVFRCAEQMPSERKAVRTLSFASDRDTDPLLKIFLADNGRFLWRPRLVRNTIEFNDGPAMELNPFQCSEDGRKIDASTAKFDKLEGIFCL